MSRGGARAVVPLDDRPEGLTQRALLNIFETFFRRPVVYLLPLALMMAFGVLSAVNTAKEYRSVGVLNASAGSLLAEITDNERGFGYERPSVVTARNINQLLRTSVFVEYVVEHADLADEIQLGLLTTDDIRSSISAQANGDTLVAVSATTAVPLWSQQMAAATMDGFVEYVVTNDIADATVRIETYQGVVADNQLRLDDATAALEDYIIAHPEPADGDRPIAEELQIDRLRSAVSRAEEALLSSESAVLDSQLAADVSRTVVDRQLRVLDEPGLPNAPVAGLRAAIQTVAVFTIVGVMLSVAFVVLAAVLDRSVRVPSDVSSRFGLEVLGIVPSGRRA